MLSSFYLIFFLVQLILLLVCTLLKEVSPCACSFTLTFCPITLNRPPRQSAKDSGIYQRKNELLLTSRLPLLIYLVICVVVVVHTPSLGGYSLQHVSIMI